MLMNVMTMMIMTTMIFIWGKIKPWANFGSGNGNVLVVKANKIVRKLDGSLFLLEILIRYRNWIRASSSSGGTPILFANKPGGGLRFCVNYRSLNAIIAKDRYPSPLIKETPQRVLKASWVSKVDVRAAFHKLRMRDGDEIKTAFHNRMAHLNGF